jgi:hypothetical protein
MANSPQPTESGARRWTGEVSFRIPLVGPLAYSSGSPGAHQGTPADPQAHRCRWI